MKTHYYSKERNTQIVISLLKANGIRKIIASPGATNICFVASVQIDPFFEVYSCIDERSAAYMACGLAAESGEPVVLSCTGATSSRNYMPGLTEAYYRKLPVLAITSSRGENLIGHLKPQVTDRETLPSDIVVEHVVAPLVVDKITENLCNVNVNKAIAALFRKGGGPAHINLLTLTPADFSVQNIDPVRVIRRYEEGDNLPILPEGKIVIFIGSHKLFSEEETNIIDSFCKDYNAVVLYDHTSGYHGECGVLASLIMCQEKGNNLLSEVDLLIHIGEISGCYYLARMKPKNVWRVNEDGEIRDFFGTLTSVFEMKEISFLNNYLLEKVEKENKFLEECNAEYEALLNKVPDLPFSNIWIAQQSSSLLPKNSVIHFGILNSLRSWNFFQFDKSILSNCNVGGFGIDGIVSTVIGATLANPSKLHFCFLGDLAFFYDMNALGNRHISKNLRILIVNNGLGQEFRNPLFEKNYHFGADTNIYIAAEGHYAHKSKDLIRNYALSLGFEYLSAMDKADFIEKSEYFFSEEIVDKPIIFEVFTISEQETEALNLMCNISMSPRDKAISKIKKVVKKSIPEDKIEVLRTLLK